MAHPKQLGLLLQGADVWNQWRKKNAKQIPELVGANLSAANLSGADLGRANLWGVDLSRANLSAASLIGVYLNGAHLSEANLSEAHLGLANLTGADLSRANLSGAILFETVFADTKLAGVEGLDTCKHIGPSTIDHRTFTRTGHLPLSFLRGCGLSDAFINYLPSLLDPAIHFESCFISYSNEDHTFAERLYADLQNKGVRCWFAPHHVQGGKTLQDQIDNAIQVHDRLLLILSEASMESEWVKTEIAKARKRELREKRQMLFPVRLVSFATLRDWECFDADTGKDSAREIREYYVPDFSNWKQHDAYQAEFEKLLRDLKAEGPSSRFKST